jgi:pristinamycin I synthase-3/4
MSYIVKLADVIRARREGIAALLSKVSLGPAPLSLMQERLWRAEQRAPGSAYLTLPFALRLDGALDPEALRRTVEVLSWRHQVLRTCFGVEDGRAVQWVCADPIRWRVLDVSRVSNAEEVALQTLSERARDKLPLSDGAGARFTLIRVAPSTHLLLCAIHHIVTDGMSTELLLLDLARLSFDRGAGGSPMEPRRIHYVDFALWQRRWADERCEAQRGYWCGKFAGTPAPLSLPCDRPRDPGSPTGTLGMRSRRLPTALSQHLNARARGTGSSLFILLLSVYGALLARYAGSEEVIVGTPTHGRDHRDLRALVGYFVVHLALRLRVDGAAPLHELIEQVEQTFLEALANQDVPLDQALPADALNLLWRIRFNVIHEATPHVWKNQRVSLVPVKAEEIFFDLSMYVVELRDGGLELMLTYKRELFDEARIDRALADYETLLEEAVANPGRSVESLAACIQPPAALFRS